MAGRAFDWLRQAERDLQQALSSQELGYYEWACFASHQAAEKAVKALHLFMGQEAWLGACGGKASFGASHLCS